MFVYKGRLLRRGEVWFDDPPGRDVVDWILYRNRSQPVSGSRWRTFYNRRVDLSKSRENLFAEVEPRTAAKITTAEEKDKVSCAWSALQADSQLDELEHMWNESLGAKRRFGMLNRDLYGPMIAAGAFELASTRDPEGELLAYGALYRVTHRAQQMLMVSPPRATLEPSVRTRTSRACSLLIWKTMLRLKEQGTRWFDFGGWYPGSEDIQLLGTNAFKRGFGGEVVREFLCEQAVTLRGRLLLTVARLIDRANSVQANS
jgi:hypothetical protein